MTLRPVRAGDLTAGVSLDAINDENMEEYFYPLEDV